MTTKLMEERGIRTVNMKIDLHKKLMLLKVEKGYRSISILIEDMIWGKQSI